jgi:hypothetical protein
MGTHTITAVVSADATPDPVTPPTTSELARTTSYPDVLAHYVDVITSLSVSGDRSSASPARTKSARRLTTPGRQRPVRQAPSPTVARARLTSQ